MAALRAWHQFSDTPSFATGAPTHQYALLGETSLLICGTGLDSNPPANITWTAPDGNTIVNNERYDLENGPNVRLSITNMTLSEAGVWRCDVSVSSEVSILKKGSLIPQNDTLIDSVNVTIQLTVVGETSIKNNIINVHELITLL